MSSENNSNVEVILKHLMDQNSRNNDSINARLDRLTEIIDKLQSHHIIVPQLTSRVLSLEEAHSDIKEKVQKLIYDSNRRDEIKKSITNPLIMRAMWSVMGVVSCALCVVIGFSYKEIDIKSKVEMINLMSTQSH